MNTGKVKSCGFAVVMKPEQYAKLRGLAEADGWRGNLSAWARWRLGVEGPRQLHSVGTDEAPSTQGERMAK